MSLLQALVRIPSRPALDPPGPVLECIEQWLADRGLHGRRLSGADATPLGVYVDVAGSAGPGPWTVLDATLDTAGFGDLASWQRAPTDGGIDAHGWLHGRGSGDSKAGVALFAHLLAELAARRSELTGRVGVLFDLDEHSGSFGGARAFFDEGSDGNAAPRPDHVFIGYPGADRIVTGGRGFLRARLAVHGIAAHSGGSRRRGINAIGRAAQLVQRLGSMSLTADADADFGLPPQLTLTGMAAGDDSFSQVPDRCELRLDIRLTPRFTDAVARALVEQALHAHDALCPEVAATSVQWLPGWPAYRVADDAAMVQALREASRAELGQALPTSVAGPSNIGNYLASLGIPALCGFGVHAENIHAANERIEIASIGAAYRIYRGALLALHRA